MPVIQARVIFQQTTGLPRDAVVNTWTVGWPDDGEPPPTVTKIQGFYNDTVTEGATTGKVCELLGKQLDRATNRSTIEIRGIDLATGVVSEPLFVQQFTLGAAATTATDLPSELAVCTSFMNDGLVGVPVRRRRGRVYLGPMNSVALDTTGGHEGIVGVTARTIINVATKALADGLRASGGYLGVWSREDHQVYSVTRGWVDNAWDIQRRRGVDATTRSQWVLA